MSQPAGNVVPMHNDLNEVAKISKVFCSCSEKDEWSFIVKVPANSETVKEFSKGYAFGSRKGAIKGRVIVRKAWQERGYKIINLPVSEVKNFEKSE